VSIDDTVRQIHQQQEAIEATQAKVRAVYGAVEESVYEQAKKEVFAKDSYPRIIALREAYVSLVETIGNRGKTRREQHVLDARHAKLTKSVAYFDEAGEGVAADLAAMQAEIKQLEAAIAEAQQA
jgi:prefoldin subunit 5